MKKKAALLVAFVLAFSVFAAGCASSDDGTDAGQTEESQAAEVETEAKVLNVQAGPSLETIDPAINATVDGGNLIVHAFEGLLKLDENNRVVPGLAERFDVSDDGLTYTFHLREGLEWSDGSPLTASDFVYAWKRLADPNTAAPYGAILNMVRGFEEATFPDHPNPDALAVSAPDDNTFVVELKNPCVYFDKIASFSACVPVQQATIDANGEAWSSNPEAYITSGPYCMKTYAKGDKIVFAKNPYYWDAERITFDEIVWKLMEDNVAAYAAYEKGALQMVQSVPTEEVAALSGRPDFHMKPTLDTCYLSFNLRRRPFDDARVREALSLAIDREYVAKTVLQGTCLPAYNMVGPGVSDAAEGSSFAAVSLQKYGKHYGDTDYETALARARELMAEAGYPNGDGFPAISYLCDNRDDHKALAKYLQQAWAKLGINCSIEVQGWKTVNEDRRQSAFDIICSNWIFDYDDPSNLLELFETANRNNGGGYSNPAFDRLLADARAARTPEAHYELLHQAEQQLLQDAACAPVAYYNDVYLQSEKLTGTWHSPYGYWYFMYGALAE